MDAYSNFFWVKDGALSPETCNSLIAKFEEHPHKIQGRTLAGHRPNIKQSTDLFISEQPEFEEEDRSLAMVLSLSTREYIGQLPHVPWRSNFRDRGYTIQRTEPGQFFNWHSDFYIDPDNLWVRALAFIFYLNDVEGEGGETEFCNGLKVKPKQGRLLFFPSDFSVYHRGVAPVSDTKYICTGWMHVTP
jgi:hypothetical protein